METAKQGSKIRVPACAKLSPLRVPGRRACGWIVVALALAVGARAWAQQAATAVATVTNGSLLSITVVNGGSGYVAPPTVTLVGGGGTGATATTLVAGGAVSYVVILTPGSGFTSAPTVMIDPPPPAVAPAALTLSMMPAIVVTGPAWEPQEVQYADALGNANQWFTLTNIVVGTSPCLVVDSTVPPGGKRLYRAVARVAPGPDPARWAWIPPGSFTMGSPITEFDRSADEGPQTVVTFSRGYWIERFEVTQGEYQAVVGFNPATFASDTNQPVEQVTWFDAYAYCARLTVQERAAGRVPTGYAYRLATEAEWECAARAGTTTSFFFGDDPTFSILPDYAWFSGNSTNSSHDVGTRKPNGWGIYDTSGNVWEWCQDWYGPYSGGSVTDPTGSLNGTSRVMRGGSWHFAAGDARSADRNFNTPDFKSFGIGFRVVLGPVLP